MAASGARTFEYVIRDAKGKPIKARIEASNQAAVANRLKTMGIAPLSISEVQTTGLNREFKIPGFGKSIKMKDLAIMARQLATMISAGLSLLRALTILAEQTDNPALAKVLSQVRNDVETGTSLSDALGRHKAVFPPLMLNMIKAGEVGGFLEGVLVSIAENFEADVKLRAQIKSAMTYPVVVFCIAILAVAGMLLFIVPVFAGMFSSLGGTLPLPTRILVFLSQLMKWTAIPLIVVGAIFMGWWRKHKNDPGVRDKVDPIKLKIPIFGTLFKKVAVARFTRNFGTMLRAGVPILHALDIVGDTSGNVVVTRAVKDVGDAVRTGHSLTGPLAKHPVFPPMVVQMMAVGEDTGALDAMLEKIAEFYDQEVSATSAALTSLIEPLMIAVLGALIGGMIIALYLPIFNVFDLIK
ncbi:MAG: type II secretion system F family protein [Cellulomonas sp.]